MPISPEKVPFATLRDLAEILDAIRATLPAALDCYVSDREGYLLRWLLLTQHRLSDGSLVWHAELHRPPEARG